MKLFSVKFLYTAVLLIVSVNAFSSDLSKRALKFDESCSTRYGKLTAKQLIDRSIDFQSKLAKAGMDGLDTVIELLEYQSKSSGAKKPTISKKELEKIVATYCVLFGDIKAKNDDGTPNPSFKEEAADHIAAIKITRDSLKRMTKPGNQNLIIHCNDNWLSERESKAAAATKPTAPLKSGSQYFYDTDRNRWVSLKGGKPCLGNNAIVTSMNKKLSGTTREKGPERWVLSARQHTFSQRPLTDSRVTFCESFLRGQHQLERDNQSHLWDISKTKLPATFTTYTTAGKKDKTLPFHISALGKKIGAKWFHEYMHTELFHTEMKDFSDKTLPDLQGGTNSLAYGFDGAVGLAKQKGGKNIAESSRNIDSILYWSLAMYYDKWVWSTGNPEDFTKPTTPIVQSAGNDRELQVEAAANKGGKRTTRPVDPPKTEKSTDKPKTDAPPPKTEILSDPPKTDRSADPSKTSASVPLHSLPSTPTAVPLPITSPKNSLPASSQVPPPTSSIASSISVSQVTPLISTQLPASKSTATFSVSLSSSGTASVTSIPHSSCSSTLCTVASSAVSATSSGAIPEETFKSEPMNAGSMTADEIFAIANSIASEQAAFMALWDQTFTDMGLPSQTIETDPSASVGTGLPMATGGLGGVMNGTWTIPTLKARDGLMERRMYDYAS